jgi:type II secretory pathway pseudopilin PulG
VERRFQSGSLVSCRAHAHVRAALTLVELLTVIAIIGLLIAVLIPALGSTINKARAASTSATIATISTSLEAFRNDQRVGGGYPPSASDVVQTFGRSGLTYRVQNPYARAGDPPTLPNMPMTGAGLLYWALAGADGLGTPGFRPFRTNLSYWGASTDSTPGGAYELDSNTRQPKKGRSGPYIDTSSVKASRLNTTLNVAIDPDFNPPRGQHFEIEAETEASQALGRLPRARFYPMFLDAFGGPILYFRGDPAGVQAVDFCPNNSQAQGQGRGKFHFRDNSEFLNASEAPLVLNPSDRHHPLGIDGVSPEGPAAFYPNSTNTYDMSNPTLVASLATTYRFAAYVRNKNSATVLAPQKSDSYLLISAGQDGFFGTADDITNFEHNGAELVRPNP